MQPGYPHSQQQPPAQSGYAQTDSGAQRAAAPASYGTATGQPGYGGPSPYSAQPVSQSGYGQQYSGAYGAGYSQPPVYPSAEATPTQATAAQQSGVAKSSPQS